MLYIKQLKTLRGEIGVKIEPKNLKELIERNYVTIAKLPEENQINLDELDNLEGYTLLLITHDYGAKTPIMWNTLYRKLGLNIRNITLVADPKKNAEIIINALKSDPKYFGGGLGVGWKEKKDLVDEIFPPDLASINLVVKDKKKLIGYNTDAPGFVRSLKEKFVEIGKKIEGSKIIIFGAGGVAKQVSRLLAEKNPNKIIILNRTYEKAISIANELNDKYKQIAVAGGESEIKNYLLNPISKPDAAINLTDKGSDGKLEGFSAFAKADCNSEKEVRRNNNQARAISRELRKLNPEIIIADIVLPKNPPPKTLAIARNEGLKNLVDGLGMVVYQAAPAYIKVQEANQEKHKTKVSEQEALEVFKQTVGIK